MVIKMDSVIDSNFVRVISFFLFSVLNLVMSVSIFDMSVSIFDTSVSIFVMSV